MKRRIVIDRGEGIRIARIFGCTAQMVSFSLTFRKNTPLARKIRKAALESGGIDTGEPVRTEGGAV
jgi:hypothetical protein